jgi:hypothetical protein
MGRTDLVEKRQETRHDEHQEDRDNAPPDPVETRDKVVAPTLVVRQ